MCFLYNLNTFLIKIYEKKRKIKYEWLSHLLLQKQLKLCFKVSRSALTFWVGFWEFWGRVSRLCVEDYYFLRGGFWGRKSIFNEVLLFWGFLFQILWFLLNFDQNFKIYFESASLRAKSSPSFIRDAII